MESLVDLVSLENVEFLSKYQNFFYVLLSPITYILNSISNSVLSKYFKTKEDELREQFVLRSLSHQLKYIVTDPWIYRKIQ